MILWFDKTVVDKLGEPYILKCNYDAIGEGLKWLYDNNIDKINNIDYIHYQKKGELSYLLIIFNS